VFSPRDGRKIRRTFPTLAAAKAWRADSLTGVRRGSVRAPRPTTVRQAGDALIAGMRSGLVRTRSGDVYKPSAIRSYEAALRLHIFPELGGLKLSDVQRRDVQRLADTLLAEGRDPSTIRNALMPLRVVYRRAIEDGDIAVNPCAGLRLAAIRGRRERIASPGEAAALVGALGSSLDRALWGTAFYAGLRLGELRGLRWGDVDLASGVIRVERAIDHKGGTIAPKSRSGRRIVPIVAVLRELLLDLRLDSVDGYVFGEGGKPILRRACTCARAKTGAKQGSNKSASTRLATPARA
jgi:integrase